MSYFFLSAEPGVTPECRRLWPKAPQSLLLDLCSRITSGGAREAIWDAGVEPCFATFKENALSAVLSLQPCPESSQAERNVRNHQIPLDGAGVIALTVGRVVLHAAEPGSIPGIPSGPPILPGVISEHWQVWLHLPLPKILLNAFL